MSRKKATVSPYSLEAQTLVFLATLLSSSDVLFPAWVSWLLYGRKTLPEPLVPGFPQSEDITTSYTSWSKFFSLSHTETFVQFEHINLAAGSTGDTSTQLCVLWDMRPLYKSKSLSSGWICSVFGHLNSRPNYLLTYIWPGNCLIYFLKRNC